MALMKTTCQSAKAKVKLVLSQVFIHFFYFFSLHARWKLVKLCQKYLLYSSQLTSMSNASDSELWPWPKLSLQSLLARSPTNWHQRSLYEDINKKLSPICTVEFWSHFSLRPGFIFTASKKLLNRASADPKFLNLERKLSSLSKSLMVLSICNQINRSSLWIGSITAAHREARKNVNLKAAAEWLPAFLSQDFSVSFKCLVKVAPHCGAVYRWLGSIDCQKIYCLCFTSNALFFLISSTVTQCCFFFNVKFPELIRMLDRLQRHLQKPCSSSLHFLICCRLWFSVMQQ